MSDICILLHQRLGCWRQKLDEGKVGGVGDVEPAHVCPLPLHQQPPQEPARHEVAGPHPDELQGLLLLLQERGHGLLQHLIGPVSKPHVHSTVLKLLVKMGRQILSKFDLIFLVAQKIKFQPQTPLKAAPEKASDSALGFRRSPRCCLTFDHTHKRQSHFPHLCIFAHPGLELGVDVAEQVLMVDKLLRGGRHQWVP